MTNDESMTKPETGARTPVWFSSFGFRVSFVIRHSSFVIAHGLRNQPARLALGHGHSVFARQGNWLAGGKEGFQEAGLVTPAAAPVIPPQRGRDLFRVEMQFAPQKLEKRLH